jgi:hypothetical protein
MSRKLAIVLRGAPGTGKTTIRNALRHHFGHARTALVSLDDGWGQGERRFVGFARYADLANQPDVLVLELGYGEPQGEAFGGATKNPREWLAPLEEEGRDVYSFVLNVDRSECLQRVAARGNMLSWYAAAAWDRYAPGGVCSSGEFSRRLPETFAETIIDTRASDLAASVAQIIQTVGAID